MRQVFPNPAHVPVWQDATEGRPVDWDRLFESYQATVDWPGATFCKELVARYPDAKVILSVRDPEASYKRAANTICRRSRTRFPALLVPLLIPRLRRFIRMANRLMW